MKNKLNWQKGYLIVELFGNVTLWNFLKMNRQVGKDNRYDDIKGVIVDSRQVTEFKFNDREMFVTGVVGKAFTSDTKKNFRFCYVVSDKHNEETLRYYISKYGHKEWERDVFYSMDEALRWIKRI